ncbi:CLUMA_CG019308, isoform A [Clunio marinus]|uniref:CLUMA_CG019308, isoform A n=1 Tax=Clunio marinus TaxID=568069 RepID=A0A1J1J1G8_9DIPT|nr:CLUMA_CG019308, isoform A [Clunio marinus]
MEWDLNLCYSTSSVSLSRPEFEPTVEKQTLQQKKKTLLVASTFQQLQKQAVYKTCTYKNTTQHLNSKETTIFSVFIRLKSSKAKRRKPVFFCDFISRLRTTLNGDEEKKKSVSLPLTCTLSHFFLVCISKLLWFITAINCRLNFHLSKLTIKFIMLAIIRDREKESSWP